MVVLVVLGLDPTRRNAGAGRWGAGGCVGGCVGAGEGEGTEGERSAGVEWRGVAVAPA